ncbi:MAG: hypothetical protein ABI665_10740 [Vicinamibacterales bacterium]
MSATTTSVRLAIFLVLVGSAAWLAQWLSSVPLVGYDDANIFLVYARNIADGHGFVYNVGGERVEGFTSVAWVLICAAVMKVTTHPEPVLATINVILVAAAAAALARYLKDLCTQVTAMAGREAEVVAIALTAAVMLAPGYIVWSTVSLMDSGLWCATLLMCALCVLRILSPAAGVPRGARPGFLVLVTLLVFVRPEAMVWGPVLLALAVFAEWSTGRPFRESIRANVTPALAFAAAVAAQTAFRLSYFGDWLPNTYYAKASGRLSDRVPDGISYFADFVIFNPAFLVALVVAVFALAAGFRRMRAESGWADGRQLVASQACVLAMLLVAVVVPVVEGGDHFGLSRMYQPLWPLVAVQAVHAAGLLAGPSRGSPRGRQLTVHGIAVLLCLIGWSMWTVLPQLSYGAHYAPSGAWNTPRLEMSIAQDMREIGASFDHVFPGYRPSVGVIVAGGFALGYHGATIDLMGLNNVAMGHSTTPRVGFRDHAAFDPAVFYALAPDIVLLSLWSPQRPDWFGFPMMSGVFDAPPEPTASYLQRRTASMDGFDSGILKGLLHQGRMAAEYRWASVRPAGGDVWVHAVFSRACLARLADLGYEITYPIRAS